MNFVIAVVFIISGLCAVAAEGKELKPIKLGLSDSEMCFYQQLPVEIKIVPTLSDTDKAAFSNATLVRKMELLDKIFDDRTELLLEKATVTAKVSMSQKYDFSEKNILKFMQAFEKSAYTGYKIKGCKKARGDGEAIRVLQTDWMHSTLMHNGLSEGFDEEIAVHYGQQHDRLLTIRILALYGAHKAAQRKNMPIQWP